MVIVWYLILFFTAFGIRLRHLFGRHTYVHARHETSIDYVQSRYGGSIWDTKDYGYVGTDEVCVVQENGPTFTILRERWYHRLLKSMGLATEVTLGDETFDHTYFIMTDTPEHLERLATSSALMKQLQALFALPVKSLHATPERLWCIIERVDAKQPIEHFRTHLNILHDMAEELATHGPTPSTRIGRYAFAAVAVHVGVFVVGTLGFFPALLGDSIHILNRPAWITTGVAFGAVMACAWLFLILRVFRRTSWIGLVLVDFIVGGLIGFILSGIYVVRETNIYFPQPAAKSYELQVLKRTCTLECRYYRKGYESKPTIYRHYPLTTENECTPDMRAKFLVAQKASDPVCLESAWYEYTMEIDHWNKPESYSFRPDQLQFDRSATSGFVRVDIHPGAFDLPWINTKDIQ